MREIKFRAWDGESKIMVPVTHMWFSFPGARLISFAQMECVYQTDDTPLMQYTGLKDKNGVEIYEGDIIRKPRDLHIGKEVVAHEGEFQNDAFVEYVDGSFRLNKLGDSSKNYYGVLNYSENTQPELLEVIGNIYENPELLEEPTHE